MKPAGDPGQVPTPANAGHERICANCGAALTAPYCSACGQRGDVARLTLRNIAAQMPRQRGLLHTLAGLARRPAQVIVRYLDGHRVEYANPLNLLTLTAGFAALLYTNHRFDLTPLLAGLAPDTLATQARLLNFQFKYRTLLQVLDLPLLAAITWLLFRGRGRGYAEHLVINAYSMSAVNILYLLLFVALLGTDGTPAFRIAWVVGSAVPLAYKMVVFYAVFAGAGRRWSTALRSLAAMAVAFGLQFALMAGLDNWLLAHVPV